MDAGAAVRCGGFFEGTFMPELVVKTDFIAVKALSSGDMRFDESGKLAAAVKSNRLMSMSNMLGRMVLQKAQMLAMNRLEGEESPMSTPARWRQA